MLRFTLTVKNAEKLDIAFGGLVAHIKDWRALWPQVINVISKAEERAFSTQGALTQHGEWARLSADYAKAKRKKYGDQMIETASSRLRNSLTGHTGDTIEKLEPLRMRWGSSVPYASYQQTGTRKMPARRLIDLTEEDRFVIQKEVQRQAVNFCTRLGFKIARGAGLNVSTGEARQMAITALGGGAGSDLAGML